MQHVARWIICLTILATAHGAGAQTTFTYDSDPGDFIGQGGSATWTDAEGTWNVSRNFDNGISFSFDETGGPSFWNLDFAAPGEVELTAGSYPNAERFPFQGAGLPGLSITGEGRGCNTLTGSFTVTAATYDWYGEPVRFAASFEQHCEGNTPALNGTIDHDLGSGPTTFGASNVLVSFGNRIYELTSAGTLVQPIPILESTGTPPSASESARDLVIDAQGRLHLYNGTFDPVLSSFTPADGDWTHNTLADWDTVNNVSYGGIGTAGDFIFVTDMLGNPSGIVRFDAGDNYSATRFATGTDYIDLTIGLDGVLYALRSNEETVDRFVPDTMAAMGSVTLENDVRGIAVNAAGTIFGASWDGSIYRFDAAGTQETSLAVGVGNLTDIDVAADGRLVAGSRFETVIFTTETMDVLSTVAFSGNGETFVAFTPPSNDLFADGFESGNTSAWSQAVP